MRAVSTASWSTGNKAERFNSFAHPRVNQFENLLFNDGTCSVKLCLVDKMNRPVGLVEEIFPGSALRATGLGSRTRLCCSDLAICSHALVMFLIELHVGFFFPVGKIKLKQKNDVKMKQIACKQNNA